MDEVSYQHGQQQVWRHLLAECVKNLGAEGDAHRWRIERADAVASLRVLCAERGGNDWPDDLYLADIIDKYASSS